jgi:hypothetical protein
MQKSLGDEVIELLPKVDWINDKTHDYFKKFEGDLVFTIAMYERHKQHLKRILQEMEKPYENLSLNCNK